MIEPTVGRVVHYYPSPDDGKFLYPGCPHAAIITDVHSERMVNVVVFDSIGESHGRTSIHLVQPLDEGLHAYPVCTWMPYQVGQAAKTEQLEKQLEGKE